MESLENKRKSNKNLIGHSKEKKQDLSVRTEEKIKTGNTEEKNHVDEIGSMVEGEQFYHLGCVNPKRMNQILIKMDLLQKVRRQSLVYWQS